MAKIAMEIMVLVAVLMMTMLWAGASAQSSCTNAIVGMSPCLNYITGNSSTPSSSCCSQLASVVASQPQCLCQVVSGGGSSLGININKTQAMALPDACNVQTPPVSKCNGAAASPSPAGTPSTSHSTPSGSGLVIDPSTDNSSDGSISKLSFSLSFFLLFIASVSLTFTSF
ncbi:non-specific lipid transfer protein GPI-anchored 5-like isoform X1 [Telopea speciosissima]|uniref:non-specific lipid transfer protein GPI-anchored 5-like isoform X1 n=1 Tax=Telopea speciosissima TaxID=54955 RepID=UPI001CC74ABB|nr:non-specific lipid transfer protein GPI-anchored 5-like isoform X1 [Telopea speciosissima]